MAIWWFAIGLFVATRPDFATAVLLGLLLPASDLDWFESSQIAVNPASY